MDHRAAALAYLEKASMRADEEPLVALGAAGVHALLHMADEVKHGLRDILYELRS